MEPSEFHRRAPLKDKELSTAKLYSYGQLQASKQPDVHVEGSLEDLGRTHADAGTMCKRGKAPGGGVFRNETCNLPTKRRQR